MVIISVFIYGVKIILKFRWESGTPPLCTNGMSEYLMQLSVNRISVVFQRNSKKNFIPSGKAVLAVFDKMTVGVRSFSPFPGPAKKMVEELFCSSSLDILFAVVTVRKKKRIIGEATKKTLFYGPDRHIFSDFADFFF